MKRLIYTSKARRNMSQRDIDRILSTSRLYNQLHGVTGLLVYHERQFLQVLEGEADELEKTYERIRRDVRHHACRLLLEERILSRAFSSWDMAYRDHQDLVLGQRLQLSDIGKLIEKLSEEDMRDNAALYVFLRAFLSSFEQRQNAA